MKNITASIANTQEEKIRLRISEKLENKYGHYVQDPQWNTGVSLEAIYIGRKWFVVEFYSVWQVRNGGIRGTFYIAYDMKSMTDHDDILRICEKMGIEPPAEIKAEDA